MSTEQELRLALDRAAQWERAAMAANNRASAAERERDVARAQAEDHRAEVETMRARFLAANDMLVGQMDAEASQAQRADTAEARAVDAATNEHWRQQHDAKAVQLELAHLELDTLRQHLQRTGQERDAQIQAGAGAMRERVALVIDTYPNRRAASEIAARVRAMPLPTAADLAQNG